jgi:hypothetical protein
VFSQIHPHRSTEVDRARWPATVPAAEQLLAQGRNPELASPRWPVTAALASQRWQK